MFSWHTGHRFPAVVSVPEVLVPLHDPGHRRFGFSIVLRPIAGAGRTLPLEVMGIVSGLLVVLSQAGDFWRTSATTPALRYIAIRSYSLYLVHVEAIAVLKRFDVPFFALYFL